MQQKISIAIIYIYTMYLYLENRIEYLKSKNADIDYLEKFDPTPNKKYLQWIIKQNINNIDIKLKYYLYYFSLLRSIDINRLSLDDVINIVDKDITIIYYNNDFFIYKILNNNSPIISKKWCISSSYKDFEYYSEKNSIFIEILNADMKQKLYNLSYDNFYKVSKTKDIEKISAKIDDFSKIGICLYDGMEIWSKSNLLLGKNLNFKLLQVLGLENDIIKLIYKT